MRERLLVRTFALVTAGTAALMLAACGGATPSGKSALSGGSAPTPTAAGTASPGGGSAPTTGVHTGTGGGSGSGAHPLTPTYATTAKAYATNVVNAYAKGQTSLVDAYTNAGGHSSFANLPKTNMNWHFDSCAPDGTYTQCVFFSDNGDALSVDIDPNQLGQPDAAVSATVDVTRYASSADGMVGDLLTAWGTGNKYRMLRLSTPSAVSKMFSQNGNRGPNGTMLSDDTSQSGRTLVHVHAIASGVDFTLTVDNAKLGKAHAITDSDTSS